MAKVAKVEVNLIVVENGMKTVIQLVEMGAVIIRWVRCGDYAWISMGAVITSDNQVHPHFYTRKMVGFLYQIKIDKIDDWVGFRSNHVHRPHFHKLKVIVGNSLDKFPELQNSSRLVLKVYRIPSFSVISPSFPKISDFLIE